MVNGFKTTLKELLTDNGFNATSFSRAIGVNMFVVRKWLNEVKDVKLKSLIKIADFFGCSLEYLCGKSDVLLTYEPQPLPPFDERIKTVLHSCGKTSYRLLTDTAIAPSQYHGWLHGTMPMLTTLETIAEYLNGTLDYLVGRQSSKETFIFSSLYT